MSVVLDAKPRHPAEKRLSEALAEDEPRLKARKGLIDKKATLVKAPDAESDANGGLGASMTPTSEQLERINQFSRKTVSAEEVVAFSTLSCNDIVDRDDDQFSTQCVQDFAELEAPFSPTGKSFMLDHTYKVENAVGRIFGTDTKKVSGALFLTNEVYVPKTDKNKEFIEDLDYGINWAVSVGVMLGKDECSLPWCKAAFSSWGWWCKAGHDKGFYYTEDAEEDAYGYPMPCDSRTTGAQKCVRMFKEPRDFYELSQVFLGAQYYAALEKQPDFKKVVKAAASAGVPTIGLGQKEAELLPLRHEPSEVSEARMRFGVKEAEDGSLVWTDGEGLRWTFDPENAEDGVCSLGRAVKDPDDEEEEEDGEHEVPSGEGDDEDGEEDGVGASDEEAGAGDGQGSGSDPASAGGEQPRSSDAGGTGQPVADPDDVSGAQVQDAVLAAVEMSGLPDSIIEKVRAKKVNRLSTLMRSVSEEIVSLQQQVEMKSAKADLGDAYIRELRADAIAWYVKARQSQANQKVSTSTFEALLDKVGEDVDLLKGMAQEQQEIARERFPKQVRRSSFPADPNEKKALPGVDFGEDDIDPENDARVKRFHG